MPPTLFAPPWWPYYSFFLSDLFNTYFRLFNKKWFNKNIDTTVAPTRKIVHSKHSNRWVHRNALSRKEPIMALMSWKEIEDDLRKWFEEQNDIARFTLGAIGMGACIGLAYVVVFTVRIISWLLAQITGALVAVPGLAEATDVGFATIATSFLLSGLIGLVVKQFRDEFPQLLCFVLFIIFLLLFGAYYTNFAT